MADDLGLRIRPRSAALDEGQRARLLESAQAVAPEALCPFGILVLEPEDVVAIRPSRRRQRIGALLDRLEHLTEHDREAPAVEEEVMIGPEEPVPHVVEAKQRAADERRRIEHEAARAIFRLVVLDPR